MMVIQDHHSRGYQRFPFPLKDVRPPLSARGEASRRKRRTPFLREEAEGRPSFGRKPPEVKLPEGRSEKSCFLREPLALPSESRHPARGEAFRRKPKEAEGSETSSESRRNRQR